MWTDTTLSLPHGTLALRQRPGPGTPVLLLHGISSGAASWQALAELLPQHRLLAWDAPGYGASSPLPMAEPGAADYAAVAAQALAALGLAHQPVLVVGHSLGALVATALAVQLPRPQLAGLLLLSPARGYGRRPDQAATVRAQRLRALAEHGVNGLAAALPARLLSAQATAAQQARLQQVALGLTPGGYTQAVGLLCGSDLPTLASNGAGLAGVPLQLAVGSSDTVTPPDAVRALAAELGAPFSLIPDAGHACVVEQPAAVAALIRAAAPTPQAA